MPAETSVLASFEATATNSDATGQNEPPSAQVPSSAAEEFQGSTSTSTIDASIYEATHVHEVYQQIAPHFSSTRYKPWPIVSSFLNSLGPGSIGLDIGCGNGKYLTVRRHDIFIVASDRSSELLKFAAREKDRQPHDGVIVADILSLPHAPGKFDFAISIAVVHHLSSRERRIAATQAILETVKVPDEHGNGAGKVLIYVWALEQKESRRGWDKGDAQDVMVPWVMKTAAPKSEKKAKKTKTKKQSHRDPNIPNVHAPGDEPPADQGQEPAAAEVEVQPANETAPEKTFHRYYHLYQEGELEQDIVTAGGVVLESGYEKDNWWAIATRE